MLIIPLLLKAWVLCTIPPYNIIGVGTRAVLLLDLRKDVQAHLKYSGMEQFGQLVGLITRRS